MNSTELPVTRPASRKKHPVLGAISDVVLGPSRRDVVLDNSSRLDASKLNKRASTETPGNRRVAIMSIVVLLSAGLILVASKVLVSLADRMFHEPVWKLFGESVASSMALLVAALVTSGFLATVCVNSRAAFWAILKLRRGVSGTTARSVLSHLYHGVLIAGVVIMTVQVVGFACQMLGFESSRHQSNTTAIFQNAASTSMAAAVLFITFVALVAPICEELFFRGMLLSAFSLSEERDSSPTIFSCLMVSLVFATMHFQGLGDYMGYLTLLSTFLLSFLGCLSVRATGNIYTSIVAHVVNNFVVMVPVIIALAS